LRDFPAAGAGAQHLNVRGRRLGPSTSAVTLAADLAPAVDATFRWLLLGSNANQPLTPICKAVQPNGASEDRPLGVPPASAADENVKMIATIPAGPPTHCATWVINIGQCVDLRQSRSEYVLGCNRSMKAERRPPLLARMHRPDETTADTAWLVPRCPIGSGRRLISPPVSAKLRGTKTWHAAHLAKATADLEGGSRAVDYCLGYSRELRRRRCAR
jgi:hypothetical protein